MESSCVRIAINGGEPEIRFRFLDFFRMLQFVVGGRIFRFKNFCKPDRRRIEFAEHNEQISLFSFIYRSKWRWSRDSFLLLVNRFILDEEVNVISNNYSIMQFWIIYIYTFWEKKVRIYVDIYNKWKKKEIVFQDILFYKKILFSC